MKKKIVIFFALTFCFVFLLPLKIKAQKIITPSPEITSYQSTNGSQINNVLFELMKIMLYNQKFSIDNVVSNQNEIPNSSISPSINVTPQLKNDITNSFNVSPSPFYNIQLTPDTNNFVYYPQCNGPYDKYLLPKGGTICDSGCGPTTVAMILASYVDKKINPITVVDMYKKRNYYLGRDGSYYYDAEKILKEYQFRTHYVLKRDKSMGGITIEEVMKTYGTQIKNLQNAGWTFFALADFKAGGHFFWVLKFDDNLNTWAYDPAYNIPDPKPINHKVRHPYPKFRVIMALKN